MAENSAVAKQMESEELSFILQGTFFKNVVVDKKTGKVTAICAKCERDGKEKTKSINGSIRPTFHYTFKGRFF